MKNDFYYSVASRVFDKKIESITKEERALVKNTISMLAYGSTYAELSYNEQLERAVELAKATLL